MDKFTELFANLKVQGTVTEAALARLHAAGASPIQTIKAIREVQAVSLGEAKRVFSESAAWSMEDRDGDALHAEIIALFEQEKRC
jgi:ribosomal protein L7/L12